MHAPARVPRNPVAATAHAIATPARLPTAWIPARAIARHVRRTPGVRPKTQPDLWRPCTPSPHPTKSAPHHRDFAGTPGPALPPAVLSHALEGAPSAPRRRHRIWGTWTPNLSARFPAAPLAPPPAGSSVPEAGQGL